MNLREAAQQALKALEEYQAKGAPFMSCDAAVATLRAALEPVTDCHDKEGDKLSPSLDRPADSGKTIEKCAYPKCLSTNGCERQCPASPRAADDHIPDAGKMVATINKTETVEPWPWPPSQESRQVEPVAYVTGFSKGYAVVEPVDRSLLMSVGMALYRSPPKREPLTDAGIGAVAADIWGSILIAPQSYQKFARAIERAHGIGGEE